MLRKIMILLMGTIMLLTACQSGDVQNNDPSSEQSKLASEERDGTANNQASLSEDLNEDSDEHLDDIKQSSGQSTSSVADIEALFKLMQQATKKVTSVTITGTSESTNIIAGSSTSETIEMKVNATLDPFVQHAVFTPLSGESGTTEWYMNEDDMFVYFEDLGWQKFIHPMSMQAANLVYRVEYFDHFMLHKDLFQLSEDNEHYIVTYTGTDEHYKDVFYEVGIEDALGEMGQQLADLIADINMSGSVEMKVAKDSYLIVEQHAIYRSHATQFGMTMEAEQDGVYTYTYNEAGHIEIPQEVIDSTEAMPDFFDMLELPEGF